MNTKDILGRHQGKQVADDKTIKRFENGNAYEAGIMNNGNLYISPLRQNGKTYEFYEFRKEYANEEKFIAAWNRKK